MKPGKKSTASDNIEAYPPVFVRFLSIVGKVTYIYMFIFGFQTCKNHVQNSHKRDMCHHVPMPFNYQLIRAPPNKFSTDPLTASLPISLLPTTTMSEEYASSGFKGSLVNPCTSFL